MAILSFELLTFTFSLWALMALKKKKFPEIFFPPAGVVVFRPPEEEDIKQAREFKESKTKNLNKFKKQLYQKKPSLPVRLQNATSKAFENIRFMADLELAVMMTYVIILVTAVTFIVQISNFLPQYFNSPNLSFYLTLSFFCVFVYYIVKLASIGGLAIYENRLSVLISIIVALLLAVLLFAGRGLISINFDRSISLQIYHLRSIFNGSDNDFSFLTIDSFMLVFLVLFIIFNYGLVPIIIKYGNSYVGMSKESYRLEAQAQQEENERARAAAAGVPESPEDKKAQKDESDETLSQLKASRKALRWFNLGLVFHLLEIFCWLKPLTDAWNDLLQDNGLGLEVLRIAFVVLHIVCLLFTYKVEISRYMLRVYDSITTLLSDPSPENLRAVRGRAEAHIGYMGVMSYQVVMKIIVPLLILLMFLDKRLGMEYQTKEQIKSYYDTSSYSFLDWNCYGVTDAKEIFQQGDMCPADRNLEIVAVQNGMGILSQSNPHKAETYAKEVFRKIQKYGVVHNEFSLATISLWLFLYYTVTYLLTLIYIFYRKAMEQV